MIKICKVSGKEFEVTEGDLKFYETMGVPVPQLCPEERQRRRLVWRNERNLYQRKCDGTGKDIISCYAPDGPHKVYHADYWWSDKWDPQDYGRDFDFERSFFEQFLELYEEVPLLHNFVVNNENCEYVNGANRCKDCYLCFNIDQSEFCFYSSNVIKSLSCVDCLAVTKGELNYECIDCTRCYNLLFSERCSGCFDSYFLSDCRSCKNCIGCFNLVGKEFYIFNKKVSEQEFLKKKVELQDPEKLKEIALYLEDFKLKFPKKSFFGHSNENSSGDSICNTKNCQHCFDGFDLEDCRYCYYVYKAKNCMDYDIFGGNSEWIYNCIATGHDCSNNICCVGCWTGSSGNFYCHLVNSARDCFGCVGLRNARYCILNKQYTREEYEALLPRIIEHMKDPSTSSGRCAEWGEFFPASFAPFGYNETIAQEFFPLTREEVLSLGLRWKEKEARGEASGGALKCEGCGGGYKTVKQELDLYQKLGVPVPGKCHECRHRDRLKRRNLRKLFERECDKCGVGIQTSFAPERPEKVFCEECYLGEVN